MTTAVVEKPTKTRRLAQVMTDGTLQPVSDNPLLGMLGQLATSPSFNAEAFRMIVDLIREEKASAAKTAYIAALAELQAVLPVIEKKGAIKGNAKDDRGNKTGEKVKMAQYAMWEDVVEGIRPKLQEHGFMLSFKTSQPTPDRMHVTAILGHKEGHTEETTISLPIDSSGAKNNVQGWGSAVSYGKRYTAFALLNIVARGEDDDAKSAGASETITDKQSDDLMSEIRATGTQIEKFLAFYDIESVSDLPAMRLKDAQDFLAMKRRKAQ